MDTFKMTDPREVVGLSPGKPQVGKVDENVEFWREAKNWSWSLSVLLYLPTQKWDRRYVFSITEIVYEISFFDMSWHTNLGRFSAATWPDHVWVESLVFVPLESLWDLFTLTKLYLVTFDPLKAHDMMFLNLNIHFIWELV